MISLHVYLSSLPDKFSDLEVAVSETWLPAMAKQPGFINAYLLQPFNDIELKKQVIFYLTYVAAHHF